MGIPKGQRYAVSGVPERAVEAIHVTVKTVSAEAAARGLTTKTAQRILMLAPAWTYPTIRCVSCDRRMPSVMAEIGDSGHWLVYCTNCREATIWM